MAEIVLLEPDTILADLYMQAFGYCGHSVRRSVSAQDAVFLIDEKMPAVVIVELQLVAHSGIEFLYELRSYSEWQDIPVLIHSCIPPTEFSNSAKLLRDKLGVRKYLYKPQTTLQTLLRSITEVTAPNEVMHQTADITMVIPPIKTELHANQSLILPKVIFDASKQPSANH